MDEFMQVANIQNLERNELRYRRNHVRNALDPFIPLNERQFIKMFRLSKELCRYLIHQVEPYMRPKKRERDLDVQTRVLAALKFFGSGCYQPEVGANKYIDICQSSVSLSVKEVSNVLNLPEIFNYWVCFPDNFEKLNNLRSEFYKQHRFPGAIGCIDCTHVAIVPPDSNDPEYPEYIYVNRKNYHSINVQLVCDANLKIINVNAKFPGSTNDAYIWNQSNVQLVMRNLHEAGHRDYFLLGDSGYPLRTWLLTPFLQVEPNTPESRYNERHKQTRVKIECCNGVLKSRFRCLLKHRTLHYKPKMACVLINACVVLHNMCIEYNVPAPDEDDQNNLDFGVFHNNENAEDIYVRAVNPELADGKRARNKIARNLQ